MLGAILAAAAVPGCVHQCTLIGWDEGMSVEFRPDLEALGDGRYQIQVVADTVPVEVVFDVAGNVSSCVEPEERCFSLAVDLPDGRRLDVRADVFGVTAGFHDGGPAGGPSALEVTVRRDGVLLATQTYAPSYTRSEPNGAGCGVATTARGELVLE